MKEVTLLQDVRYFSKPGESSTLFRAGRGLKAGTTLTVGDKQTLTYDHKDQEVVPLTVNGKPFFMITSEMNSPELIG